MKMTYCAEYCIEMPDDFPVDELTRFMAAARRVLLAAGTPPAWQEFGGASNLIGWRFRASSEDCLAYKTSLAKYGDEAAHDELYRRERYLFGMFSAGVSCIEATTYALAALASHPSVLALPFGLIEQRGCTPRKLVEWLTPHAAASALVGTLTRLHSSQEWQLWVALRNRMAHRTNLPRNIFGAVGGPAPIVTPLNFAATSSTPLVDADISDFERLRNWLAISLEALLLAGRQLVDIP